MTGFIHIRSRGIAAVTAKSPKMTGTRDGRFAAPAAIFEVSNSPTQLFDFFDSESNSSLPFSYVGLSSLRG